MTAATARLTSAVTGAFRETGRMFALAVEVVRLIPKRPFQFEEFITQAWFIIRVTLVPSALVSIPFGATIALQLGSLTQQVGAQSFTGAAGVLATVQQAAPISTALLIAGAAGSAVCADLGARTIREEIDAMKVLGVSPIQRLIVPRVLAMIFVAVLLNGFVSIVGVAGGYCFNVFLQDGTPGAYLASFNALSQLPDLWISERLIADGNLLLGELQARKDAIDRLLTGVRDLSTQLSGVISDNQGQLRPALRKLDRVATVLARNRANLAKGLQNLAPFYRVFTNTLSNGRWFDGYICGLLPPSVDLHLLNLNSAGCEPPQTKRGGQ